MILGTKDDSPSQSAMFAYLPPWLGNTISAKVTGQGPAITRSGLSFGVLKEIANCAKNRGGLSFGDGASLGISRHALQQVHKMCCGIGLYK